MCIDNFTCLLSSNACTSSNGVKDIGANLTGELTILQQRTFGMCDVATNYATAVQSSLDAKRVSLYVSSVLQVPPPYGTHLNYLTLLLPYCLDTEAQPVAA